MPRPQTIREVLRMVRASRAPRIRGIRQWCEEELVIPEGFREGSRYRADTLPWQGLWLDEIDSGNWNRFVLIACVQGGKTLVGFVAPCLWHLFEWREPVLLGIPQMEMAGLKWRKELRPAIAANPKFRDLLPEHGRGSKGGSFESLTFGHGPDLSFLSGKGGDEKRSGITARVVSVTEADRVDDAGEDSEEAAPIFQMEARIASFEGDSRFYAECTRTTSSGFVSREYEAGSASRIMCPCQHCGEWVSPEREDLVGHEDAQNEMEAAEITAWYCPACGELITDAERRTMNVAARLVHRGQTIDRDGEIQGPPPPTKTLGFRANAFNNLMWSTEYIAAQEWRAKHDRDEESGERKMRQWYWALPVEPNAIDITPLELADILGTQAESLTRGVVPAGTFHMAGAADIRKRQLHFGVVAFWRDKAGAVHRHVVDIGVIPVLSEKYGIKKALLLAMRQLRDKQIEPGYEERGAARKWRPGWFPIDAYWFGAVVKQFARESQKLGIKRYLPSFGRGLSAEHGRGRYQHPEKQSAGKPHIGDQFYIAFHEKAGLHAMIVNADYWKTQVREGFATPAGEPGSISIFEATTEDEQRLQRQFGKEIVAERAYEMVLPERGVVVCYANDSKRPNHFGDVIYNSLAAGYLCGVRIDEPEPVIAAARQQQAAPLTTPDGRPFFVTDRGNN